MTDVTFVPFNVSPLPGALVRNLVAGGTVNIGDIVYAAADGSVQQANASASTTAAACGIVTAIGTFGALTGGIGDAVSVVKFGPVSGFSGLTPGAPVYSSNDAGKIATAPGTTSFILGYAESTCVLFVQPSSVLSGTVTFADAAVFVSAEQTGTGASQSIAHGLGVVPSAVLLVPTSIADSSNYAAVEGVHTTTNVLATVTSGDKFKVLAWA